MPCKNGFQMLLIDFLMSSQDLWHTIRTFVRKVYELQSDNNEKSLILNLIFASLKEIKHKLQTKHSYLQGVQTLSVKSNLLILPIQSWSNYNSLGSNWPQDKGNLF